MDILIDLAAARSLRVSYTRRLIFIEFLCIAAYNFMVHQKSWYKRIGTSRYFINFHLVISMKIRNYFVKSAYTFSIIAKINYLNPVILISLIVLYLQKQTKKTNSELSSYVPGEVQALYLHLDLFEFLFLRSELVVYSKI